MAPSRLLGIAITAVATLFLSSPGDAYKTQQSTSIFSFSPDGTGLQLGGPSLAPEIRVSPEDFPGVIRVANDLAADFGKVLGVNGTVVVADWSAAISSSQKTTRPIIIVGTAGKSTLIDNLVATKKVDVSAVANKWEAFTYQVAQAPWAGKEDGVFVIAGSDLRGTVFGAYDVAERIGVSPWYWWADVPPTKRQAIWVQNSPEARHTEGPPSVKYRGIFLNDESPGLTSWGHAKFKDSKYGSPFITDFYKRIFELVLRLKGNYVWPAMWSSMFYLDDENNGPTATLYGIFMGTSHHEPMARADKEQGRFLKGSWDWKSNKAGVQTFMQEGATRSRNWSTIYTLGMRGSGDAASATLTSASLVEIIKWQQSTLTKALGKPLSEIPQTWVMYKEVPGYWQKGMDVSDDVTLLWSDDNRGNIRRVPVANETNRRGGSGIYYHFDYVGSPRNYKWINTIQLQKTWEQMTLAYDRGIRNIWLANVGDLKALELPTAHFMALAWDRSSFDDPGSTTEWLTDWSGRQFGEAAAAATSSIMTTYGKLTARMKYEDLSNTPFAFNAVNYDEAELNYKEWTDLLTKTQAVYDGLPSATQNAFFEVVLHPVLAGKTVYEIYTKVALGAKYANEHRISANQFAKDVQSAFAADSAITKRFHSILDGRWNHLMDQTHIGYNNWQEPSSNSLPRLTTVTTAAAKDTLMGVTAQGSTSAFPATAKLSLPALSPFTAPGEQRWLDVYLRDNGTLSYKITSSVSFITITDAQKTISSTAGGTTDSRALITADWAAAPRAPHPQPSPHPPLENPTALPPADFKGHIEASGVVSIEAEHSSQSLSSKDYTIIPTYGRTLSGVRLPTASASQSPAKGPVLVYPFFTFTNAASASLTFYLSPSENANPSSPNRYSFSIDNGTATTVQPVPLGNAGDEPAGWSQAVIENAYVKKATLGKLAPGRHELRVWLLEPTMVLTKLVVDVGGLKTSLMGRGRVFW
ncbi:hypothetical protein B0T17DRAFT_612306 [Bombardia bombarda]|uniref:Gylcosyl hydrolase 115 C-terminal domain-containing protein n=1 Tax=Bombardia bombarda TaxID=252184 RepID=A0AA39XKR9_9PEZI|nr:hypothetical protein B0T17DRAFT_612306 [Bombardia bombarda]